MTVKFEKLGSKGRQKVTGIAKAATRLFSHMGYLETTMEDIAAAANTSKGGVYHYFDCKTDILYYILTTYLDLLLLNLEQDLSRIADNVEKIRFIISRHIQLYVRHQNEAKVGLHEAHCLPEGYLKVTTEKERKYFEIVRGVVSDFSGGTLPKGQLTTTTFLLFGLCNWIYSWYDPKGPVTPEELSEMCCRMFIKGLKGIELSQSTSDCSGRAES